MANTHSTVKHFEDIGKIYTEGIATEGQLVKAATPKDIAFDSKTGHDIAKGTGPEAADGFAPAENDPKKLSVTELEGAPHNTKKLSQNVEKESARQINNSTMREKTNKSTFDRLFEDVMGEEFEDLGEISDDMGMGEPGDELGEDDLGGDMVTLELPRELAEQLHQVLMDQLGGDDEGEIEDLEGADEFGDEVEEESHVELANAPDGTQLTHVGQNKVPGAGHAPSGGSASADAAGQEDGGKLKAAKDGKGALQNKSNKVGGKVTGGNKDLFKV
jgi:hypothetical protein